MDILINKNFINKNIVSTTLNGPRMHCIFFVSSHPQLDLLPKTIFFNLNIKQNSNHVPADGKSSLNALLTCIFRDVNRISYIGSNLTLFVSAIFSEKRGNPLKKGRFSDLYISF